MNIENAVSTQADVVRQRLEESGLSQRAAARELGIAEREMRRYCAGDLHVPPFVFLSLRRLVQIRRNEEVIGMLHSGALSTSEGPLTEARLLENNAKLRQAIDLLLDRQAGD